MIDIIIPAYKAIDTLKRTLDSIKKQTFTNYNITLVLDSDNLNYNDILKNYNNINTIILNKNVGPGLARQIGIDNTNNDYLLFIDADDYLYDENVLNDLINAIEKDNNDLVISKFIYERDNTTIVKEYDTTWLHGKLYSRKFIKNNNIHFNNSRYNEDNGFNRLLLFCNPKIANLDYITYVYSNNKTSITRSNNREYEFNGLEWLSYNILWAINEAEKRGFVDNICPVAYSTLVTLYYSYLEFYNKYDVDKILVWSKNLIPIIEKYDINEYMVYSLLNNKNNEYKNKKIEIRISFEEFISLIKEKNS